MLHTQILNYSSAIVIKDDPIYEGGILQSLALAALQACGCSAYQEPGQSELAQSRSFAVECPYPTLLQQHASFDFAVHFLSN